MSPVPIFFLCSSLWITMNYPCSCVLFLFALLSRLYILCHMEHIIISHPSPLQAAGPGAMPMITSPPQASAPALEPTTSATVVSNAFSSAVGEKQRLYRDYIYIYRSSNSRTHLNHPFVPISFSFSVINILNMYDERLFLSILTPHRMNIFWLLSITFL